MSYDPQYYSGSKFELVLHRRNEDGVPTGKTFYQSTESASDLSDWYENNKWKPRKKKKKFIHKNKKHKQQRHLLPDAKEAQDILKKMYGDK